MRRYLYRGAYRRAIRAFPGIGTGKTFGDLTDQPPGWDQVSALRQARAARYAAVPRQAPADLQPWARTRPASAIFRPRPIRQLIQCPVHPVPVRIHPLDRHNP